MKRIILLIILFSLPAAGQQLVVKTKQGTFNVPTQSSVRASLNSTSLNVDEHKSNERIGLIVELSSPSVLQQKKSKILRSTDFVMQHSILQQQIAKVLPEVKVAKSFSTLFNAVTVSAERKDIEQIRILPGVKKVYEDLAVMSSPYQNSITPSQIVAGTTAASGKGVRVGIIDTGIDYMHEALGNGYGLGHTVSGGYDFVNNDDDPMDDNGHGTHVAGIIAGRSATMHSLAPNSLLFAYKALDAGGNGIASNVIAAIERAIADSVSIINISLGSNTGNPNDVLCEAVNRAVDAGIVVVVAAGNAGEFESVNSPGIARNALTVGASDGKMIAPFSSKGPVSVSYDIKPDVVAPGVGIVSAKLGGGYVTMSGTSMATPYVTSVAAAIKEVHPDWSPELIKNAIVTHSVDLGTSLFAQGNGMVDPEHSIQSSVIVSPSHISFGFDVPSQSEWKKSDTIMISNYSTETKRYTFSSLSTNPAIQVVISPSTMDVPAQTEKKLSVTVSVNNLFLANGKNFSDGQWGSIVGISNDDTIRIPYTFFKGTVLQIEFSTVPWQVLVHDRSTFATTFVPKGNVTSVIVNDGIYDIVTSFFGSTYVVKEDISVSGRTSITIDRQEAKNTISIIPINEHGDLFSSSTTGNYSYVEGIVHKSTGHSYVGLGGGLMNTFQSPVKYISNCSDRYTFAYAVNVQQGTARTYTFDVALDSGITSSKEISFNGEELKKVEMKYTVTNPAEKVFPLAWSSFVGTLTYVSVTFYDGNDAPLMFPYIQTTFYSNRNASSPIYHFREAYRF